MKFRRVKSAIALAELALITCVGANVAAQAGHFEATASSPAAMLQLIAGTTHATTGNIEWP